MELNYMLEPDTLQAFVAVAEEGHFVRAGNRLGWTQSAVSKKLCRLEDQLGARLFNRNKRSRVALTREGEQFFPIAVQALEEWSRAEEDGRRIALGELGSLRIGYVFSSVMTGVLPRLIRHLRRSLPDIEIIPTAMETPAQISALADGKLDICLCRARPSFAEGTRVTLLHTENIVMAVCTDNPLASEPALHCADFAGCQFIVPQFHEEVGLIGVINAIARTGDFALPPVIRTSDFITTAGLVAAGVGVAPVPASLAALTLDGLAYVPVADLTTSMDLVMLEDSQIPSRVCDVIAEFCSIERSGLRSLAT